jgi:hypothetical protein
MAPAMTTTTATTVWRLHEQRLLLFLLGPLQVGPVLRLPVGQPGGELLRVCLLRHALPCVVCVTSTVTRLGIMHALGAAPPVTTELGIVLPFDQPQLSRDLPWFLAV